MAGTLVATGRPAPGGWGLALVKALVGAVAFVIVFPLIALYRIASHVAPARRDAFFQGYSQLLSLWPGITGTYLRGAFYRATLTRCAPGCTIGFGTIFATPDVELGEAVYLGAFCNIGHTSIGRDTLIGSNVTILSGKHQHHFERPDVPVRLQGGTYERVHIGVDTWIGNGAIILTDVASHAVVAAGSVVVKAVDAGAIVGGNPARVIGQRAACP